VANVRHVDPDLMRAPGLETDDEQRMGRESPESSVVCHRPASAVDYGHPGTLERVTADWCIDGSTRHQNPLDQGAILPVYAATLELIHEGFVGLQGFGHYQEPACVLV
jgi:hypothetical protein